MSLGSIVIGGGALLVAAEVATWCFRAAAKSEQQHRGAFARSERAHRAAIVRETNWRLAQEAYEQRGAWLDMLSECWDTVWEMRNRTRDLSKQFRGVVRANQLLIKNSPLTFQQQEAIRDCIFHLERGIARLQAYSGPYLQGFIESIRRAQNAALDDDFIEPAMPDAALPDDFPVVGDNLRLSPEEAASILRTGALALGCDQVGRLARIPSSLSSTGVIDALVEDYVLPSA